MEWTVRFRPVAIFLKQLIFISNYFRTKQIDFVVNSLFSFEHGCFQRMYAYTFSGSLRTILSFFFRCFFGVISNIFFGFECLLIDIFWEYEIILQILFVIKFIYFILWFSFEYLLFPERCQDEVLITRKKIAGRELNEYIFVSNGWDVHDFAGTLVADHYTKCRKVYYWNNKQ